MVVFLAILSAGLLGLIIYFAVSPKSTRLLRLCSIIALSLICLSLVVSGIFLLRGPGADEELIPLPVFQDSAPEVKKNTHVVDLLILAALMGLLVFVIVKALKDQKKAALAAPAPAAPIFPSAGKREDSENQKQEQKEDDAFNIDIDF